MTKFFSERISRKFYFMDDSFERDFSCLFIMDKASEEK